MSWHGYVMPARLENRAVRNFGLAPRPTRFGPDEYPSDTRNRDTTIVTITVLASVAVAVAIYALASGYGGERDISGFIPFLP